jgi:glycine hydroxymethyltransferase
VQITVDIKGREGAGPKLKDFKAYVDSNDIPEIKELKAAVETFAKDFPTVGFEKGEMRYKD